MHIGLFCSSLGLVRGGLEIVAEQLAKGLAGGGHEVSVVVGKPFFGDVSNLDNLGLGHVIHIPCFPINRFPVHIVGGRAPGLALRTQSRSFLHACRRDTRCVDVVTNSDVTVSFLEMETVELSRWRKQVGKPHVSYFPGGIRWSDLNRDVSTLRLATSQTIASRYRQERFRIDGVVAPGVNGDWLNDPFVVRSDASSVVFVGRMEENKGLRLLLAVMKLIAAQRPDVVLTLIGSGPLLRWVKREVVIRGLTRQVRILGDVPHERVKQELQQADLFVFPSRYESFGIAVLEAMAVGTPVVCSNLDVVTETAGQAVVTLEGGDPGEWATKILTVLSDVTRRHEMSRIGRARAGELTWERAVQTMEEHLRSLVAK